MVIYRRPLREEREALERRPDRDPRTEPSTTHGAWRGSEVPPATIPRTLPIPLLLRLTTVQTVPSRRSPRGGQADRSLHLSLRLRLFLASHFRLKSTPETVDLRGPILPVESDGRRAIRWLVRAYARCANRTIVFGSPRPLSRHLCNDGRVFDRPVTIQASPEPA